MSDTDKTISELEALLPALSGVAFAKAREQMLAAGQSVLRSENGLIYRVLPDGSTIPVKQIAPPIPVAKGSKVKLW